MPEVREFHGVTREDVQLATALSYYAPLSRIITAGTHLSAFEYPFRVCFICFLFILPSHSLTVDISTCERASNIYTAHESSVVAAQYNEITAQFFTASETDIKIWDANTGRVISQFPAITNGEITSMCIDERGRKYFVSSDIGELKVFQTPTSAYQSSCPHSVVFVDADLQLRQWRLCQGLPRG